MDDILDVRLAIRVDEETKEALDTFCLSHGTSISEVGRKAIKAYMKAVRRNDEMIQQRYDNDIYERRKV